MRITVGHVLIIGVLGGGAFIGLTRPQVVQEAREKFSGISESVLSFGGFFKSKETPEVVADKSLSNNPSPETAVPAVVPSTDIPAAPAQPVDTGLMPALENPDVPPAPVKRRTKKKRVRRHKRTVKPVAVSPTTSTSEPAATPPAAAAAPATPQKKSNGLVGSYVTLELKTGRKVKGILQEKNAMTYKVELPGLGVFEYPVDNVKSVTAAE